MDPLTVLHLVTTVATGAYSFTSNAYMVFQAFKAINDAPKHAQELQPRDNPGFPTPRIS